MFPDYTLAKLVKTNVVGPADWFETEIRLNGRLVVVKNPNPETRPNSRSAVNAGARTGLVTVSEKLYIALVDKDEFRIQRPVISDLEERELKKILREKFPLFE